MKLFEMLPILGLFLVVHHDVGLILRCRASKADPPGAPVLKLFHCALLDAPDEILHHLGRPRRSLDEGGEIG